MTRFYPLTIESPPLSENLKCANTILYCRNWQDTVCFYQDWMGLPVHFANDWFVASALTATARLSIADERRASVKSCAGQGFTLALDLADRPAIRGQLEGPISFGFNVIDENDRPILFDDTVRPFLLDFMARRINVQLERLQRLNPNAFMFVDEPGLQFIFSALAGYGDLKAKGDMDLFFSQIDRPRGIHLCGNPDWDFLLNLDLEVLSLDVYTNSEVFASYAPSIKRFLDRGAVISPQELFNHKGTKDTELQLPIFCSFFSLCVFVVKSAAIMANRVDCHLAASTGVHDAAAVVKLLLAGADAVQTASGLYQKGPQHLKALRSGLEEWMAGKRFQRLADFQGRLSQARSSDPAIYERAQFMRYFGGKKNVTQ